MSIKIDNSKDSAVTSGRWSNPGASLFDTICKEPNYESLLDEAYLQCGEVHVTKDKKTSYSNSGCKYPHHVIRDGKLVVSEPGVKAAYQRAKQMGIFKGEVKKHLERHYRELGIYADSTMNESAKMIDENFNSIESFLGIEEPVMEGFFDKVKNAVKKFTGFLGVKRSLANLQNMDRPDNLKARCQLTIPGTNIVINTNASAKNESADSTDGVDLFLYNEGAENKLSKNDIKNIVNKLRKKFQCEIIFAAPTTTLESLVGPAAAIETDRRTIERFVRGKDFDIDDRPKSPIYGDEGEFEKFIIVSPKLMSMYHITSAADVELVLSHEYGHIKTFDQVTPDEWIEYAWKKQNIVAIAQAYGMYKGMNSDRVNTDLNWYYHKLKPEKLANEAAGVDPKQLIKCLLGLEPSGKFDGLNLDYIVNLSVPKYIIDMTRDTAAGVSPDIDDVIRATENGIDIFTHVVLDESYRKILIDATKQTLEMSKRFYGKESAELHESSETNIFSEMGDTPDDLMRWMNTDIQYDHDIKTWRLKSPETTIAEGKGNCHDQSLLQKAWFDYHDISNKQIFFIEYNEGEEVGGSTHTFSTFIGTDGEFYWFEHAWENYRGIHGPFNTRDQLVNYVHECWKKDDDINQGKYQDIAFFYIPNYEIGMTLGTYVESWYINKAINESLTWIDSIVHNDKFRDQEFNETNTDAVRLFGLNPIDQRVVDVLKSQLKSGKITQEEYDKKVAAQKEKSGSWLFPTKSSSELMKSIGIDNARSNSDEKDFDPYKVKRSIGSNSYYINCILPEDIQNTVLRYFKNMAAADSYKDYKRWHTALCKLFKLDYDSTITEVDVAQSNGTIHFKALGERTAVQLQAGEKLYHNSKLRNINVLKGTWKSEDGVFYATPRIYFWRGKSGSKYGSGGKSGYDYIYTVPEGGMTAYVDPELHGDAIYVEAMRLPVQPISSMKESGLFAYQDYQMLTSFTESKEPIPADPDIEKRWFITSSDGVDNCCIKVKGYDKPMRGRSSMITLKHENDRWYVLCKQNKDDYGVPGGGWNKGEEPKDAATRELGEETLSKVKDVKRMGTLIEYHEDVAKWVKDHVDEKDWWYGYYSAIFVGVYDGEYEGEVDEHDREYCYQWKNTQDVINEFPKEYSNAIKEYLGQLEIPTNEFDEKSHGGLHHSFRLCINKANGHMIKVVFDLKPEDIRRIGSHDDTNPIPEDKWEDIKKNINKAGCNDFTSMATCQAIIDMDTGEHLQTVKAVGVMNGNQQFAKKTLQEREKWIADGGKFYGGNKFTVGEKEDEDSGTWRGSYKTTTPAKSMKDLEKIVNPHLHKESTDILDQLITEADDDTNKEESGTVEEQPEPVEDEKKDDILNEPVEDEAKESDDEPPAIEPKSLPKQTDEAEVNKNGVNRKKLYIAFIEWCKEYNQKNTFGSNFDKDVFKVTYPFVPNEMRYFYRLANPNVCVLSGDLTFFPLADLRKLNSANKKLNELMIFAATPNDMRVFSTKDKKVYLAIEDDNEEIKLTKVLGETFDLYIQTMIKKGDILNSSLEETPQGGEQE